MNRQPAPSKIPDVHPALARSLHAPFLVIQSAVVVPCTSPSSGGGFYSKSSEPDSLCVQKVGFSLN